MNYQDWYTDKMDVYRTVNAKEGALTRKSRERVLENVPCRIYRPSARGPTMSQTAASYSGESKLACDNSVDIRAGDELRIVRGGMLGHSGGELRFFAGRPEKYYEPFGAVMPGLAHQEVTLLEEERIK